MKLAVITDFEALLNSVKANKRNILARLVEQLGCHHPTVEYHLHQFGFESKLGIKVPHELMVDKLDTSGFHLQLASLAVSTQRTLGANNHRG
jgi:hypothetical protein